MFGFLVSATMEFFYLCSFMATVCVFLGKYFSSGHCFAFLINSSLEKQTNKKKETPPKKSLHKEHFNSISTEVCLEEEASDFPAHCKPSEQFIDTQY